VRLVVGSRHHDQRPRPGQRRPTHGKVRAARSGGHAQYARFRQMGPKGVDDRGDAAITAA